MRGPIPGLRRHFVVSVALVCLSTAWLVYLLGLGGGLPALGDPYRLKVVTPNAASLASNARVTMAGADVGKVTSVRRRGLGAVIEVRLDDDAVTPLPADSRASIRQRTALGENYLAIDAGRSDRRLRSGDAIPVARPDDYVDVDQVLSVLHGSARDRARTAMRAAGAALSHRGSRLNALLDNTSRFLTTGSRVVRVLDRDRPQLARLTAGLGDLSRSVAERGDAVERLAAGARTTFRAIAGRETQVRALLDELPETLTDVRTTTTTLSRVSDVSAPVLDRLAGTVGSLRPALSRLEPAGVHGRELLVALGAAAPGLQTTFERLSALAPPTADAVPRLREMLCQLNPALEYVRPYAPDISQAIVGMNSSANAYDATGHYIRVGAVVNEQLIPGLPSELKQAIKLLSEAGLLSETHLRGYDPYPLAGQIGAHNANDATGPAGVTRPFPRLQAHC